MSSKTKSQTHLRYDEELVGFELNMKNILY